MIKINAIDGQTIYLEDIKSDSPIYESSVLSSGIYMIQLIDKRGQILGSTKVIIH